MTQPKPCSTCRIPLTDETAAPTTQRNGGLCRKCQRAYINSLEKPSQPKPCSVCRVPLTDETAAPTTQRRGGYCRKCQRAYMARYYQQWRCQFCGGPTSSVWTTRCKTCANAQRKRATQPNPARVIPPKTHYGKPTGQRWRQAQEQVWAEETHCGFCGEPVDQTLHHNDPMARCVDHITPIALGGHMYDRANLRLAHRRCNSLAGTALVDTASQLVLFTRAALWLSEQLYAPAMQPACTHATGMHDNA